MERKDAKMQRRRTGQNLIMLNQIGDNISVINGDMFRSKMQTLAITVNS